MLTRNTLDRQLTLTVPAAVERSGALALPSASLAALVDGFPPVADVVIEADGPAAQIRSGRGRYKLPVVAPDSMPAPLALAADVGAVVVSRADALALFAAGFAAAPTSDPRSYLWGLHVAGGPDGLAGVSTDGYQLVHRILPGVPGWGGGITIPTPAVKIVGKLLAAKSVERVVLRHSATLIAIETPTVVFISRLLDGTFPDFRAVVPKLSDNVATVGRAGLLQALARIHAVGARTVRLSWIAGSRALHLTNADTEDSDRRRDHR